LWALGGLQLQITNCQLKLTNLRDSRFRNSPITELPN
jgi:hypothetical protein